MVGLGGFLGAVLRYTLSGFLNSRVGGEFPVGTLAVNVVGCLAIGAMMGLFEGRPGISANVQLFLTIGLLGAFTTFSTFGFEVVELIRTERVGPALGAVAGNVILGCLAVLAGRALVS